MVTPEFWRRVDFNESQSWPVDHITDERHQYTLMQLKPPYQAKTETCFAA